MARTNPKQFSITPTYSCQIHCLITFCHSGHFHTCVFCSVFGTVFGTVFVNRDWNKHRGKTAMVRFVPFPCVGPAPAHWYRIYWPDYCFVNVALPGVYHPCSKFPCTSIKLHLDIEIIFGSVSLGRWFIIANSCYDFANSLLRLKGTSS